MSRRARWDGAPATLYDVAMAPLERGLLRPWRGRVRRALRVALSRGEEEPAGPGRPPRVLEVGAGTGRNRLPAHLEARVVAVDRSVDMLRRARRRGYSEAVVADAEALPFPDDLFAAGVETLVWCEVERPVDALAEVRRVLAPGARFVMLDHVRPRGLLGPVADALSAVTGPWMDEWWNRDTRRYVRPAGFRLARSRDDLFGAVRTLLLENSGARATESQEGRPMKAAFVREHGDPSALEVGELPDPRPGPGEVALEVRASALNHLDLWVRRGLPGLDLDLPHVGGSDMAGVVAETGDGVDGWEPGDRVVVNPSLWCGECEWCARGEHSLCDSYRILGEHVSGGLAERAVVPARNLYPVPEDYPLKRAAAAPLVFQTAWRGLVSRAGLEAGETALVTAASGGVGTAAVQIAALAGAEVYAVTSGPENAERVADLGADHVVDRLEEDFSEAAWEATGRRGVDVVLDSVGEAAFGDCVRALAKNGRLVTYGATTGAEGRLDIRRAFWKQLRVIGTTMASRTEFERVMALVFDGRLEPVIDQVWPIERVREAHERLEEGEQFGKIVLVP